ncbi:cation channel sperm-associated auxiliary subunit delta-like isoform X2 [Oncorhynchus nerka]|uniref:cation channel sperm-associated auxiliary subunit delta-like isoform X2 n=1 Tax=Oncorhynchus nerka TaxID=8023 RepID=UPI0031B85BCF
MCMSSLTWGRVSLFCIYPMGTSYLSPVWSYILLYSLFPVFRKLTFTGCPPGKHAGMLSCCFLPQEHNHLHKGHVHSSAASGQLLLRHPQYVFLVEEVLFRPSSASSDLHISYYSITHYFCPLLVYHGTPWIPSMELWNGNELVEQASGDFVMFEVNGMHNYQYHQSGQEAKCVSQPKNWTSLLSQQQNKPNPNTAQTRNIRTATIR